MEEPTFSVTCGYGFLGCGLGQPGEGRGNPAPTVHWGVIHYRALLCSPINGDACGRKEERGKNGGIFMEREEKVGFVKR